MFTPESMVMYLRVFNFLWRAKRMEYILAGIWKGQMANARFLRAIPGSYEDYFRCNNCNVIQVIVAFEVS